MASSEIFQLLHWSLFCRRWNGAAINHASQTDYSVCWQDLSQRRWQPHQAASRGMRPSQIVEEDGGSWHKSPQTLWLLRIWGGRWSNKSNEFASEPLYWWSGNYLMVHRSPSKVWTACARRKLDIWALAAQHYCSLTCILTLLGLRFCASSQFAYSPWKVIYQNCWAKQLREACCSSWEYPRRLAL